MVVRFPPKKVIGVPTRQCVILSVACMFRLITRLHLKVGSRWYLDKPVKHTTSIQSTPTWTLNPKPCPTRTGMPYKVCTGRSYVWSMATWPHQYKQNMFDTTWIRNVMWTTCDSNVTNVAMPMGPKMWTICEILLTVSIRPHLGAMLQLYKRPIAHTFFHQRGLDKWPRVDLRVYSGWSAVCEGLVTGRIHWFVVI